MMLNQLTNSPAFSLFTLRTDLAPSITYFFGPFQAGHETFNGTVWFYSGIIIKLEVELDNPHPEKTGSVHVDYLRRIFGNQNKDANGLVSYKFPWGSVAAGDWKGEQTGIFIQYSHH